MDILHISIKIIGAIIMAFSVVCVYDARKLVNKFFGSSDINSTTKIFKIIGMILFCVSAAVVIWG